MRIAMSRGWSQEVRRPCWSWLLAFLSQSFCLTVWVPWSQLLSTSGAGAPKGFTITVQDMCASKDIGKCLNDWNVAWNLIFPGTSVLEQASLWSRWERLYWLYCTVFRFHVFWILQFSANLCFLILSWLVLQVPVKVSKDITFMPGLPIKPAYYKIDLDFSQNPPRVVGLSWVPSDGLKLWYYGVTWSDVE